ncbi:MAG TPA: P1 family peptidase, partial [Actinomycetota bacterium]
MERGRARDLGVVIGTYPPGPRNAVTDVEGVRVGHRTIVRDPSPDGAGAVRTGVTTVFPHEGLPWIERVYAGTDILNGFGELIGINQIAEWGLLHSPVVMTSSLAIGR